MLIKPGDFRYNTYALIYTPLIDALCNFLSNIRKNTAKNTIILKPEILPNYINVFINT